MTANIEQRALAHQKWRWGGSKSSAVSSPLGYSDFSLFLVASKHVQGARFLHVFRID